MCVFSDLLLNDLLLSDLLFSDLLCDLLLNDLLLCHTDSELKLKGLSADQDRKSVV